MCCLTLLQPRFLVTLIFVAYTILLASSLSSPTKLKQDSSLRPAQRTMGDNLLSPSCPCCAFLPNDLFLPATTTDLDIVTRTEKVNQNDDVEEETMLSPLEALKEISREQQEENNNNDQTMIPLLVDTHGHAHLDRETQDIYTVKDDENNISISQHQSVVSLTCAVSQSDWEDAIQFASQSEFRKCGLGIHPWYLENLSEHYLTDLESLLKQHPSAIVGEIGLCKVAKFIRTYSKGKTAALELQRSVFQQQMRLAAQLQRPVSVHCVKQHGVLMKVLKELATHKLPPAIGMHSFTGTAHHVKELLKFEEQHCDSGTCRTKFYFGFSHCVNVSMCSSEKSRRKGRDAVRAVPLQRLLAESDVHSPTDVAAGTAGAVAYLAWAKQISVKKMANITARNGMEFLNNSSNNKKPASQDCTAATERNNG